MKTVIFCLAGLFAINTSNSITGTWNVSSAGAGFSSVVFKNNGTYECYTGNTVALNGTYTFNETDSTLIIEDDGCYDITGTYRVHLSGNADSLRFTPVNDDCFTRKVSVQSALLTRPGLQ